MVLMAAPALAGEPVNVRMAAHDGYGRVVFEFAVPASFSVERAGDRVILHFAAGATIPTASGGTRNVSAVDGGESIATVTVASGSQIHTMQIDRRVVLDVRDPVASLSAPKPEATVVRPTVSRTNPVAGGPHKVSRADADSVARLQIGAAPPSSEQPQVFPALGTAAIKPAAVLPVIRQPEPDTARPAAADAPAGAPISVRAEPVEPSPAEASVAALFPFGPDVGAAAFRRGSDAWVVFDEPRPLDVASLKDTSGFNALVVQVLPAGTLLRLPIKQTDHIRLRHQSRGWSVAIVSAPTEMPPLTPVARSTELLFPITGTGQSVVVADPATGQNLLVGTLRATGPGVPVGYRVPEFNILPSWQGVVAEPLSDRATLRTLPEGIAIQIDNNLSSPPDNARALTDAAVLTRRFDFPSLPVASLLHRLQAQSADAAAAPPQSRLDARKAAAQTMIALGLGPEAQSLLQLASTEDPRAVTDPEFNGLSGIAALISGRPSEADGLLDADLSGSDEISVWRAALAAGRQEGSPEAASLFKSATKLILSYPDALRNWLLPLAAETMANGGAPNAADALLEKLPDEPRLALARAMRLQAKGDNVGALAIYDSLAGARDRLLSARAATYATLLRLSSQLIDPAHAADNLERGFLDWRGDDREWSLRLRVIDLRAQAGQWRAAFNLLKETAALYPDQSAVIHERTSTMLTKLLRGPDPEAISAIDLVTLAEENAEEAAKAAPDEVTGLLADRLVALDLPRRAAPVLQRMIAAAPPGIGRATLGARLAAVQLAEGDLSGTVTLNETDSPDLPAALVEQRGLLDARFRAQGKDVAGATAILARLGTAAADDLRATILAEAGDWRGSEAALFSLVKKTVPETGELSSVQQDALLRLASAQAKAGDDEAGRQLGIKESPRMVGPRSDMFRLLTAAPVSDVGDLHRAAGEIALARAIPAGLSAIGAR